MSKTMVSIDSLLASLRNKNLLVNEEKVDSLVEGYLGAKQLPLAIKILSAFGALIAAGFFLGCLNVLGFIDLIDGRLNLIIWGLLFMVAAIAIIKLAKSIDKNIFMAQTSFVAMVLGKYLVVAGVWNIYQLEWLITLAILLVSLATFYIYSLVADRFISVLALLLSIFYNITQDVLTLIPEGLALDIFILLQLIFAGLVFFSNTASKKYIPLGYALVVSLCINTLHLTSLHQYTNTYLMIIDAIYVLALIGLVLYLSGGVKTIKIDVFILSMLACLLLGIISAPGILLSIILLIVGYAKQERYMTIFGIALLPLFIFIFYYNMDITLLQKSLILIGSGFVLLIARFYLKIRGIS